jgi:hypothetical protein
MSVSFQGFVLLEPVPTVALLEKATQVTSFAMVVVARFGTWYLCCLFQVEASLGLGYDVYFTPEYLHVRDRTPYSLRIAETFRGRPP